MRSSFSLSAVVLLAALPGIVWAEAEIDWFPSDEAEPRRGSSTATRLVASGVLRASQLFDRPVGLIHGGIDIRPRARV